MTARALRRVPETAPSPDPAALLATLPVACVQLDADGRFQFANPAAEHFFGLSAAQLQKIRLRDLLPPDNPVFLLIDQVRTRGVIISERDLTLESPRLSHRGVAITGTPLPDEPGALILTFYDWSAALALDRQVKLRQAARSVAGMAAILAHEVKNPLSGIRGAAQLLEATVGPGDRELAVLIREETDRIRALLDRMEVFGDRPIERGAVNIHRVLDHVRRLAQTGFAAHLRITEQYDPSLPPVWGNRDQLVQVLLNLIKNAAEAITEDSGRGEAGEIVLHSSYQQGVRLTAPGQSVRLPIVIAVRDNGPGIPPDIEKTLFEPFMSTKAGGSGLGLALVAKIVGDHGGLIEVESRPGRTEFRLFLPVFPEDPADRP